MIYSLKPRDMFSIVEFLQNNKDDNFYYTDNNQRIFIKDLKELKKFLKNTILFYYTCKNGDISGIISIWKSIGNNLIRHYVKINCQDNDSAKKLLKNLVWNCSSELFCKIRKQHRFLPLFFNSGFRFVGDRGSEIIIKRDKPIPRKKMELSNGDSPK